MKTFKPILILTLITSIIVGLSYFFYLKPQIYLWDETGFIWLGYEFHKLILAGDWGGFWALTRKQVSYPFFQGWYLGFASLPFQYSLELARALNLLLLIPTVIVVWFLGKKIDVKMNLLPILSVFLVLSSPGIIYYFSTAMKEGMGLLLTLLIILFYWLARERQKWYWYSLAGLSLICLFFVKNYYAVYPLFALGTESLLFLLMNKNFTKKEFWLNLAWLIIPFIVTTIYWVLILPGNLRIIVHEFVNIADFYTTFIGHVLFYPQEWAFTYTFSWVALLIILGSFVWTAIKYRTNFKVRSLVLLFLINYALAIYSVGKNQARYHFTTVPAMYIVGSYGLALLLPKWKIILKKSYWVGFLSPVILIATLIMVYDLVTMPLMVRPVGSHQLGGALYYEQDYQNVTRFDFNRRNWPHIQAPAGSQTVNDIYDFIFQNVDVRKNVNLIGQLDEFPPYLFMYNIEVARDRDLNRVESNFNTYFITLEVTPGTRFDTADYHHFNYWPVTIIPQYKNNPGLTKIAEKYFDYLGVRITILGG